MRQPLPETTLRLLADAIAARTTFRSYDNGNSSDTTEHSTPAFRAAIYPVALGTLLGLNYGDDARSASPDVERIILNTAEFTLMQAASGVNGYDTIYNPLRAVLDIWRLASDPCRSSASSWASRLIWDRFPAWRDFFDELMPYSQPDEWCMLPDVRTAESTLSDWHSSGLDEGLPAHDAGLLFLLWNLYVSDHEERRI